MSVCVQRVNVRYSNSVHNLALVKLRSTRLLRSLSSFLHGGTLFLPILTLMIFQIEEIDHKLINEFRILCRLSQLRQNLKPGLVLGIIFWYSCVFIPKRS